MTMELSGETTRALAQKTVLRADPALLNLLKELEGFSNLLREYNIYVGVHSEKALEAWAALPELRKRGILKVFSEYHATCQEVHASGVSLRDNRALTAHSLRRAGLSTKHELNFVTDEKMVEIYNLENVQTFRSVNFFDYCNYTLLDVLAREWYVLYERLDAVNEGLFDTVKRAIESGQPVKFQLPPVVMKERDSNPRGIFQTHHQMVCPVYGIGGSPAGFLVTLDALELDVEQPNQEEKVLFLRN